MPSWLYTHHPYWEDKTYIRNYVEELKYFSTLKKVNIQFPQSYDTFDTHIKTNVININLTYSWDLIHSWTNQGEPFGQTECEPQTFLR